MFTGLDIQIDFAMYESIEKTRQQLANLKKGGKPLGGKLLKIAQQAPKEEAVKMKEGLRGPMNDDNAGGDPNEGLV